MADGIPLLPNNYVHPDFVTPEQLAAQREYAQQLMYGATGVNPNVKHWTQALAQALQGGMGGYQTFKADQMQRQLAAQKAQALDPLRNISAAPQGQQRPMQFAPDQAAGGNANAGPFAGPVSAIESSGDYAALGPVTKSGDRAYGKYQVMGANIGSWTKEILGKEMTPDEFRQSPEAQDAVFKGKFGQYVREHGPEGAALKWFTGSADPSGLKKSDQLGTTGRAYVDKFNAAVASESPQDGSERPLAFNASSMPQGADGRPGSPAGQQMAQTGLTGDQIVGLLSNPSIPPEERRMLMERLLPQLVEGVGGLQSVSPLQTKPGQLAVPQVREFEIGGMRVPGIMRPDGVIELKIPQVSGAGGQPTGQGGPGDLQKNLEPLARAAAGITAGAGEVTSERGIQTKYVTDIGLQGSEHKALMARLENIKALGEQAAYGGPAKVQEWLGKWGVQTQGLPEIEAYKAAMQIFAPLLRPEGSGSLLGPELQNFNNSLGSLMTTPQGRQYAFQIASQVANYKINLSKIANGSGTIEQRYHRMQEVAPPKIDWERVRDYSKPPSKGSLEATGGTQITRDQAIAELKRRGKWQGQ